ncbi:MAG: glycoside hydrolase family 3 C-terminal domain-containing protein, partial [Eubacteriales bacterium]|nr:glycoside hydrolase family 3 C-terminal domain-containing protein [Eubacteriales bacterium]
MIKIEMSDVIGVLQTCKNYLIALAVIIIAAIAVMIIVRKKDKPLRKMICLEALFAMLLGIIIVVNSVVFGPMYTLVSLSMGSGTVSEETTVSATKVAEQIAEEGFVLLQNQDGFLPMEKKTVNVFGWAASNPVYGGTGSGGINALYEKVSLIDSLKNAGFEVNQELMDFYTAYCGSRAEMSIEAAQNWDLPEPPVSQYTDAMMASAKEYSDTAIIVISRIAGEGHTDIPQDMT